jgi:hypothetical protein
VLTRRRFARFLFAVSMCVALAACVAKPKLSPTQPGAYVFLCNIPGHFQGRRVRACDRDALSHDWYISNDLLGRASIR